MKEIKFFKCGDSIFNAEFVVSLNKAQGTTKPYVYMINVRQAEKFSLIHFDNKENRDVEWARILTRLNA